MLEGLLQPIQLLFIVGIALLEASKQEEISPVSSAQSRFTTRQAPEFLKPVVWEANTGV